MIMDLPVSFSYGKDTQKNDAYIENGILKIRKTVSFKRIMKEVTFELNGGKHKCGYCNKTFENEEMTIDHMYPQTMGGPTITNNLVPSCNKCNSDKTDMTYDEFIEWNSILKKQEQDKYLNVVRDKKRKMRKRKEYQIPKEWYSQQQITTILVEVILDDTCSYTKKYKQVERFHNKYGYFQKPIIVDKNGVLLDGYNTVIFAKNHYISTLPVIKLENVEVIFNE